MIREGKVTYDKIKEIEPKKFNDLEYTMKLIFNHDENPSLEEEKESVDSKVGKVIVFSPNRENRESDRSKYIHIVVNICLEDGLQGSLEKRDSTMLSSYPIWTTYRCLYL
jgi:hypothetical protein